METKTNLPQRPVVLRAPWVALAGECAGRFFLAGTLCAGQVLGDCAPFALGFVAASGAGAGGFFALIGAVLGYLLALPLALAFRYIATAILIYAVAFAFGDLKLYATRWFMPCCAGALGALTGFVYLAEAGWATGEVISFFTEVLLVLLYARVWGVLAAEPENSGALLLGLGGLASALTRSPLPFGLSLGAILSGGVVVWLARSGGQAAAGAGLILGLFLDLSGGGGSLWAAGLALGGLLAAPTRRWPRWMTALGFCCGMLAVTLWSFGLTESFAPFWNGALGCLIWLLVPEGVLARVKLPAMPLPDRALAPAAEEAAGLRLRRQSEAFRTLHDQLRRELAGTSGPEPDGFALLTRASVQVCPGCVFRSLCWKRDQTATRQLLRPAWEGMLRRGQADPGDFPGEFTARCSRINELVNAANRQLSSERTRQRYHARLLEGRREVCRQYGTIARLLGEGATALDAAVPAMATPKLTALAGVAAGKRPGQSVSGDAGGWFRDEAGVLWVILCDGMGSGADAARDSRWAYKLLEQFLSAGVSPEVALSTVGSALALRWETQGSFTTIDLLQLDLTTGEGVSYKLGAAPTYLRRGSTLSRISASTLPAGLQSDHRPDVSRFRLQPGDLAVLVSDGVTDGEEDDWIRQQIRGFDGASPKELAGALLGHTQPATDDRTAIVLLIGGKGV